MLFPFQCTKCDHRFDGDFPIGKAPRETPCPKCSCKSKRVYAGMSFGVRISNVTHPTTFGEQMKARNAEAAHRMKGRQAPVRAVAHDFGNGDVREIVKPKKKKVGQVTLT
jgi:predicted nucleic acid-binding Zn ribbon protein